MDFYLHHGRVDPTGGPQSLDDKGVPSDIDDWGFDGPRLTGVIGFHCTYGTDGYWNLWFNGETARDAAAAVTGWELWEDRGLTVRFSDDHSLVAMRSAQYDRDHYFGDWGII